VNRYSLSAEARRDVKEIWKYISVQSESVATRQIDVFFSRFSLLAMHPMIGEQCIELADNLRRHICSRWVIYYRLTHRGIRIVRVVDGARDLEKLF